MFKYVIFIEYKLKKEKISFYLTQLDVIRESIQQTVCIDSHTFHLGTEEQSNYMVEMIRTNDASLINEVKSIRKDHAFILRDLDSCIIKGRKGMHIWLFQTLS